MLEGVVEISTFYRYGVCICTSADIRSQTSRAMDLVIYNSGVAFCQTTSSTGQTCTTLAGVYSGDPLMWQLIWLKANQWMPNDWMAVYVMDEYSNGVVLCGGNGWNNQFNQNGCNYPSADAFIVGYSYGGISFPSTPYYSYSNPIEYCFVVGVWSDNGEISVASTSYFMNFMQMQ